VTDLTVTFFHAYDAGTVQAADLTVNDIPADHVTLLDSHTVVFHYDISPVTAQGPQTMRMSAGAVSTMSPQVSNPLLQEWTAAFSYIPVPMEVTSSNPASDALLDAPVTDFTVTFSLAYDAGITTIRQ
jgi:hypothetical protein